MKIPIFKYETINPLSQFGLTSKFWEIHTSTLLCTWLSMAILFAIVLFSRIYLKHKPNPLSFAIEQSIEFFVTLCKDSFGFFKYEYFSFVTSLFLFTLFCNFSGMLPFVSEPTEDINTALACGISSFFYVQCQRIKISGIQNYIKSFFQPIFILFPLNITGELAKVLSMSFRLFGNILGGSIIVSITLQALMPYKVHFMTYIAITLPIIWLIQKTINLKKHQILDQLVTINTIFIFSGAWLLMFFNLFEGLVQAFVITMLTITYLALSCQSNSDSNKTNKESSC